MIRPAKVVRSDAARRGWRAGKLAGMFCGIFLGMTGAAAPASHQVGANPDNTFSPRVLVIQPGDSVTWTNLGGFHNVLADDASFRCSDGCDDTGQTGEPGSGWSFTRTFPVPADIPYHCEVHTLAYPDGFGMRGQVIVALFNDGFEDETAAAWSVIVP